jgi:hypothetical protein
VAGGGDGVVWTGRLEAPHLPLIVEVWRGCRAWPNQGSRPYPESYAGSSRIPSPMGDGTLRGRGASERRRPHRRRRDERWRTRTRHGYLTRGSVAGASGSHQLSQAVAVGRRGNGTASAAHMAQAVSPSAGREPVPQGDRPSGGRTVRHRSPPATAAIADPKDQRTPAVTRRTSRSSWLRSSSISWSAPPMQVKLASISFAAHQA